MSNNIVYNKNNNLNDDNAFLSKKTRSIDIEKNKGNKKKKIDNNSNKNIKNDNTSENDRNIKTEKIELNNSKRDNEINGLNYKTYCIINDSYCPILIDNSFVVFESIKNMAYLIYSTKNKYIVAYNLTYRDIESKIPSNHSEYISNFKYCFNSFINKELIMSISFKDSQLKIWRFEDWQCIIDIKNVYFSGYLYSACFLNKQNHYYFVTSNWKESKFCELIKVYDYKRNIVKSINNSKYNSFLIKTLYNKEDTYILVCNEDNIKSYDYNKNDLFKLYKDSYSFCKLLSFQIYKNNQRFKILGSCQDRIIRVWDFFTGKLMNKIEYELNELRGIITYNESILIGIEDNLIQFIDLKNHKKIITLNKHEDKISSIQKKLLKNYGSCIFSQSFDNKIIFWNLQN
jgi:WD40 repeat protein